MKVHVSTNSIGWVVGFQGTNRRRGHTFGNRAYQLGGWDGSRSARERTVLEVAVSHTGLARLRPHQPSETATFSHRFLDFPPPLPLP